MKSPTGSPAENLDAWLSPGRFAIVLLAAIVALFPDAIFANRVFVFHDSGAFTYPVAFYEHQSFWHGRLPLWNPLNDCGIPFLAQWNTSALYPLSVFYLLLPVSYGLTLFFMAHLFLAGLGMYFLAFRWTNNRVAAGIGGMAFAFSGLTLNCLLWVSNLAALAWMPWVILLVELACEGRRKNAIILAGIVGAVQMLTGSPEIIVLTWAVCAANCLLQFVEARQQRLLVPMRWLWVGGLVALLSAAQLLPFLDLLAHSQRSEAMRVLVWPIPTWGWANLLVPLFHCDHLPNGLYMQPEQNWTSSYYFGIVPLALALVAPLLDRRARTWGLLGAALLGFILAMGEQGLLYPALLKALPCLGFMRFPIKFAFLAVFAVPLLAAQAVAALRNSNAQKGAAMFWMAPIAGGVVLILIGGIMWHVHVQPSSNEHWPAIALNGSMRAVFLILGLGAVLFFVRATPGKMTIISGALSVAFIWGDLATHCPRQNPTVESAVFEPGLLKEMNVDLAPDQARAFRRKQTFDMVDEWMLPDLRKDFLGRRAALIGDCNLLDNVSSPDGFYSLYTPDQQRVFWKLYTAPTNQFPEGLADFMSVARISNPTTLFEWDVRSSSLPICSLGQKPVFVDPAQIPDLLLKPDFDPRKMVYLPVELKNSVTVTNETSGTVRITRSDPEHLEYEVQTKQPALMVLSQSFYHWWRASVDGMPVAILPANYAFQAIEVPPGQHAVTLIYADRGFEIGAGISITTLAACVILYVRGRSKSTPQVVPDTAA